MARCGKTRSWQIVIFVFSFVGLFASNVLADTEFSNSQTPLPSILTPYTSGETLHYKLSYRGLLTSMIWADLADVKMTYLANKKTPDKKNAYQFELFLSTQNYTKAEMFQPVRYTYTTTQDALLQRTVLVEEVDTGKNQSHDFLWLDWHNKETQLYKKRQKEQLSSGFIGMDVNEVWEKDGSLPVPLFLAEYPLLEDQQTYLIHKESGDKIKQSQILDPLSLIYTLRSLDFGSDASINTVKEFAVAVSDDIRLYQVTKVAQEKISLNNSSHFATKYKIQTDEKKDNYYYVWLSNDKKKIPLRLTMDAPLGKLEIDLMKVTQ